MRQVRFKSVDLTAHRRVVSAPNDGSYAQARDRRKTAKTEGRFVKRVLAIILGGGAGTRLYPLTKLRAKPAVPLGAKYRLIDIPISNCINSEIQRIYVLT